jgi:polyferredoxin
MRKATAAIVIWSAVMALLAVLLVTTPVTEDRYRGFAIILFGVPLVIGWLIGFMALSVIWFLSRPKHDVAVYGPQGQQMLVSEKEAKFWVEKKGWAYQPHVRYETAAIEWMNAQRWGPPPGGQPPYGGPPPQR